MKVLMILVFLFFIGAFFIISQNNLALNNADNIEKFSLLYKEWCSKIFYNIGNFAVYFLKFNWLP